MRNFGSTLAALTIVSGLGVVVGCGGASAGKSPTMSQPVGSEGGTVTLSDGAKLVIPAGALGTMKTITVSTSTTVPAGYTGYSPVYEFGPAGLHFDMPVAVTLPFQAGSANPAVYWSRETGAGFDELGGTVDGDAITAMVTHFSKGFVAQAGGPTSGPDGGAGTTGT